MQKKQQNLKMRFFSSRLFLIVLFVLAVFVAFGYARAYYQDYKIKQEIKALQNEVKALEKKKLESINILDYVSGSDYVEDKARIELNMKDSGEHVVYVQNNDQDKEDYDSEDRNINSGHFISNQLKWLYYFIHKSPTIRGEENNN